MFMLNGDNDIIVSAEMAKDLFEKLPSKQPKDSYEEQGLSHNPFMDGEAYKKRVKFMCDWF
jgi:fermentation-respiration switch protein FrsA (DUF1100 family)